MPIRISEVLPKLKLLKWGQVVERAGLPRHVLEHQLTKINFPPPTHRVGKRCYYTEDEAELLISLVKLVRGN